MTCRWGEKDRIHDRATDRAHDHAFNRSVHFVPSPVPCLSPLFPSRPSHLFISSVHLVMRSLIQSRACRPAVSSFRLSSSPTLVPFLSPLSRQVGRGVVSVFRIAVPCPTSRLVRCREMWRCAWGMSQDVGRWGIRQASEIDITIPISFETIMAGSANQHEKKDPSPNRWRVSYLLDSGAPFSPAQPV